MLTPRAWAVVCLLVAGGLVTGCDKKVRITWINGTDQDREVELSVPGQGNYLAGTATANGGKLPYEVKIPKADLPAQCSWKAGDLGGDLTITKKTPKKLRIDIWQGAASGPADKNAEIGGHEEKQQDGQSEPSEVIE